jgi:hypothetical protein
MSAHRHLLGERRQDPARRGRLPGNAQGEQGVGHGAMGQKGSAASSEKAQGSMNLASNTAAVCSTMPSIRDLIRQIPQTVGKRTAKICKPQRQQDHRPRSGRGKKQASHNAHSQGRSVSLSGAGFMP